MDFLSDPKFYAVLVLMFVVGISGFIALQKLLVWALLNALRQLQAENKIKLQGPKRK